MSETEMSLDALRAISRLTPEAHTRIVQEVVSTPFCRADVRKMALRAESLDLDYTLKSGKNVFYRKHVFEVSGPCGAVVRWLDYLERM